MEEENVIDNIKRIEELVYNYPILLLDIKSKPILDLIDTYLPYSCGMEFECFMKYGWKEDIYGSSNLKFTNIFKSIPNIIEVSVDSSEQRYRIPNGLKGMICLYEICQKMKKYSALDLRSSNHYHFDFTDIEDKHEINNYENREYILKELITWETAKDLSNTANWTRFFNPLGTLEIRIGEPTFDYNIIIKRLIQGCKISKYLKDLYYSSNEEKKLLKLNKELEELNIEKISILPIDNIKKKLKLRINKI